MKTKLEPWWIKNDREFLTQMRNAIEGKTDNESVWYIGDQRGMEPVPNVRAKIAALEERIKADIERFNAAGGDYDKM